MGKITSIAWCDHTFNPWHGCQKISEGCDNCYAAQAAKRFPDRLGVWGAEAEAGTRVLAAESTMKAPASWNRAAARSGFRRRVFCGSIMDFFEDFPGLQRRRLDTVRLMHQLTNLDWLLLTKRPENICRLTWRYGEPYGFRNAAPPNVWFGCTVENQARAEERIDHLLGVPCAVRFLSVEPMLEDVALDRWLATGKIHWVIVGGESEQGGQCRPFHIEWAESVVVQCDRHRVPVFVKQMGSHPVVPAEGPGMLPMHISNRAGTDPNDFPPWLQRREFPRLCQRG